MKKIITLLIGFCFGHSLCFAQLFSFISDNEPSMGLMDFHLSYGYMNQNKKTDGLNNFSEEMVKNTHFVNFHLDESMLSNWWYADDDTRVLFGFREVIDVGLGYGSRSTIYHNALNQEAPPTTSKMELIFSYEAGFGGVYRINKKMDAGLNYYFLSLSSFNKTTDKYRYPKFRFRYSNFMGELSIKARTQFELKYLSNPDDEMTSYIGLTVTGWNNKDALYNQVIYNTTIVQVNFGFQL